MPTQQLAERCTPTCARLCAPTGLRVAYSAYAKDITGYAHRRLGDLGLAEEITHDVFVRAWRHCAGYDDTAPGILRTWLFTIARNAVIDAARARERRPRLSTLDDSERPDPVDAYTRLDAAHLIADTLPRIAPRHRDALTSVYLDGHTYETAASILGVPVGTVKSRVHTGLTALRSMLAGSR